MRLQDLRQRLYARQSDIESRKPQADTYDPRTKLEENSQNIPAEKKDYLITTDTTQKQKTLLLFVGSVVAGLILLSGGGYLVYKIFKKDFRSEQIQLKVELPPATNLNEEITVQVLCANNNPLGIKNAHLNLQVPPGFAISSQGAEPIADAIGQAAVDWNLGVLPPQENKIFKIRGRFFGREEDSASFKAFLRYTPDNSNLELESQTTGSTKVVGIPISLFIEPTREVAKGMTVSYQIKVRNNGKEPFQGLVLKINYPLGFSWLNSSSGLDGDKKDLWNISTLLSNEEKVLTIEGKMEGNVGEQKILTTSMGKEDNTGFKEYLKKEALTTITEPPVAISQEILDGKTVVHKGDELNFIVSFSNKSNRPIGKAIAKVKVEGLIFDSKSIFVENGGAYDSNTKEVVWQGGNTPELAVINPNSENKLRFKLKVADNINYSGGSNNNFIGKTTVLIESPEMPTPIAENRTIVGNTLDFKLSTDTDFRSTAYYNDGTLPNTGPVPPTIGSKTTYSIHWTISNSFNDLKNIEIKSVLPYGVEWLNKIAPSSKGLEFRENTREIIWNLERIPAGAGYDKPLTEIVFQVGITPKEDDYGKSLELLGESNLTGSDAFTGELLSRKALHLTTILTSDASVTEDMSKVVKPGD